MHATRLAMKMGLVLAVLRGSLAFGLDWDTSTASGYQHGNGAWSEAKWTSSGTSLGIWTNGNSATFIATAGSSMIVLDGLAVTNAGYEVKGDNYTLVVTNGGRIVATGLFIQGTGSTLPTNNTLFVVGGDVGVTSRLDHTGAFWVGYAGHDNRLVIDGVGVRGSAVVTVTDFDLGYTHSTSKSNNVTVRRGGRLVISTSAEIGRSSSFQTLTVADGGILEVDSPLYIGNGNNGRNYNTVRITGPGTFVDRVANITYGSARTGNRFMLDDHAIVTNVTTLRVGDNSSVASLLSITDGGMFHTAGLADFGRGTSRACTGLVSGAGSIWNLGNQTLQVGQGTDNCLLIENGGIVTNAGAVRIGAAATASGNRLRVAVGGRVYSKAASAVGYTAGASNNLAWVGGAQSLWDLGAQSLTIGTATGAGNALTVDSGIVTNINALTVHPKNSLNLLVGTISSASVALNPGSVTVVGIAGDSGPGAGWGRLASSGAHVLGGTLKPVLLSDFKPSGETAFVIMANTGGSISGTFGNAGDGDTIPAYDEDLVTPVGEFTVAISATAVTLHFVTPPGGTLLLVR